MKNIRKRKKSLSLVNSKFNSKINFEKRKSSSQDNPPNTDRINSDIVQLIGRIHRKSQENNDLLFNILQNLQPFTQLVKNTHGSNYLDTIKEISFFIQTHEYEKNIFISKYGYTNNNFYLILNGKIDVLGVKEKTIEIGFNDYLRYIGYLIGYKEYEIIYKVLQLNWDIRPIIIEDIKKENEKKLNSSSSRGKLIKLKMKNIFDLFDQDEKSVFETSFKEFKQTNTLNKSKKELNTSSSCENIFSDDSNLKISGKDYIVTLKNFQKTNNLMFSGEKKEKLKILEFYLIKTYKTGDFFCGININPNEKSMISLITRTNCLLGKIPRETYPNSLKEVVDNYTKQNVISILTTELFINTISPRLFNKKFSYYFVGMKKKKHFFILKQNGPINHIYLLIKGIFDVNTKASLNEISAYIHYIYKKLKTKNQEIDKMILEISKEDDKIKSRAKEIETMEKFYFNTKTQLNISTFFSKEIIGLSDCLFSDAKNPKCFFNFEIKSDFAEYFQVDIDVYDQIKENFIEIGENEQKVLDKRIQLIIKRLYDIRQRKVKKYFEENPDYFFFSEYIHNINQIDVYKDVLKIKEPTLKDKRRKCLSATINRYNSIRQSPKTTNAKNKKFDFRKPLQFFLQNNKNIKKKNSLREFFLTKKIPKSQKKTGNNSILTYSLSSVTSPKKTPTQYYKIFSQKQEKFTELDDKNKNSFITHSLIGKKLKQRRYSNDNSSKIDCLLYNHCPLISIAAHKSLMKKKANSTINIFSYQESKKKQYIENRNYATIKNTRDVFTRYNSNKKFIYK